VLISPAISESIKAAISKYTAEELITKRTETRAAILELLKGKLENRGITIHDINIINF
jgi:regulator of protease activity HflC (stomatin/prohibitin superfamily)